MATCAGSSARLTAECMAPWPNSSEEEELSKPAQYFYYCHTISPRFGLWSHTLLEHGNEMASPHLISLMTRSHTRAARQAAGGLLHTPAQCACRPMRSCMRGGLASHQLPQHRARHTPCMRQPIYLLASHVSVRRLVHVRVCSAACLPVDDDTAVWQCCPRTEHVMGRDDTLHHIIRPSIIRWRPARASTLLSAKCLTAQIIPGLEACSYDCSSSHAPCMHAPCRRRTPSIQPPAGTKEDLNS